MKNTILFLFFVLISSIYDYNTYANENSIIFTGNEARPPKIFLDENKKPSGILVDVTKLLMKSININVTFELFPWKRAYSETLSGKYGIIGISKTKERLETFDFSEEPIYYDKVVLVVKKDKSFVFNEVSDLKNKKIGTAKGASYGFEESVKNNVFEQVDGANSSNQLEMLLKERIDAVLISSGEAGFEADLKNKANPSLIKNRDKFLILPKAFDIDPNYIAFAKVAQKKDLLKKIDTQIRSQNKLGKIEEIIKRYSK